LSALIGQCGGSVILSMAMGTRKGANKGEIMVEAVPKTEVLEQTRSKNQVAYMLIRQDEEP
jgi:hypothetical protein